MARLEGGLNGLKADPSAGADDQDSRHGFDAPAAALRQSATWCPRSRTNVTVTVAGDQLVARQHKPSGNHCERTICT